MLPLYMHTMHYLFVASCVIKRTASRCRTTTRRQRRAALRAAELLVLHRSGTACAASVAVYTTAAEASAVLMRTMSAAYC